MSEKFLAAARKRGKTETIVLDGDTKVVVRELTPRERLELYGRLFQKTPDGEHVLVDGSGNVSPTGEYFKVKEGMNVRLEWLRATMTPIDELDVIMSDDVPESLRDEIFSKARSVNGFALKEAAKN